MMVQTISDRLIRRLDHFFHRVEYIIRHSLHTADPSAMNRLEANRFNLTGIRQAARIGIRQLIQTLTHGNCVIWYLRRQLTALVTNLDETRALR